MVYDEPMASPPPGPLRARWLSEDGAALAGAAWKRLAEGLPLDELALERVDGRLDLRGITATTPQRSDQREVAGYFVETMSGVAEWTDVSVRDVDFSWAPLDHLESSGAAVSDCLFVGASLREARFWTSEGHDSSFGRS